MASETANRHSELSRRLIEQAAYELNEKGDRLQASEKASGAVAQAIKAIAEDREWRHGSHNLRREISGLIAAEFDRPELIFLHGIADQLHENFYEDRMPEWHLQELLALATRFLESLLEVRGLGANPDYVPSPAQQRSIDRLRLTEEEVRAMPSTSDLPPPMPPFVPAEVQ